MSPIGISDSVAYLLSKFAPSKQPLKMRVLNTQTETKLNYLPYLPKRLLYMILDMVYFESDASINMLNSYRPEVPYEKLREISFEHRIMNTKILRSVCRAFHKWALENVLHGRMKTVNPGGEIEIDGLNFERLVQKFGLNRAGVFQRLFTDFPDIVNSRISLYLGDPLHRINVLWAPALKNPAWMWFSRFSFSDKPCIDTKKHLGWPLKIFRSWEKLNVYMTVCCGSFEGIDDGGENPPKERNWTIRASHASSPCMHTSKRLQQLPSGRFVRISHVSRSDWDEKSVWKLMESCRDLRRRYEARTKQRAAWNIDIHLSVLMGDKIGGFCVHDMVFKPLDKPPTAVVKRCSGGKCDERMILEEGWMEVRQKSNDD